MVGDQYAPPGAILRKVQNNLHGSMEYGQAVCYGLPSEDAPRQLSGLKGLHGVYCARLPPSADQEIFDDKLKEAILNVLSLAVENKMDRLVFPLPGCDKKTGGTGGQLAKALYGALYDFRVRHPDTMLSKLFLPGADMDVLADECQIVEEFQHQWFACERFYMERRKVREPVFSDPFDTMLRVAGSVARTEIKAAIKASAETVTETAIRASAETVTEAATEASAGAVTRADQSD